MKRKRIYIQMLRVIASFFLSIVIFGCHNSDSKQSLDFDTFTIKKLTMADFLKNDAIKKVVKLETTDQSIVGEVDSAIYDDVSGKFFVGDYFGAKKILCFSKDGKFLKAYGNTGQGPGEYDSIYDFTVTPEGNMAILSYSKLIVYDKNGTLKKEIRLNYRGLNIESFNHSFYVYVINYTSAPPAKKTIIVYDEDLKQIDSLANYDERVEKYKRLPNRALTICGSNICFTDFYDSTINFLDPKSRQISSLKIPSNNQQLDKTWSKKHLTEEDIKVIGGKLHRFEFVMGMDKGLFLLDICNDEGIFAYWTLNLKKKAITVYNNPQETDFYDNNLYLSHIVGSYKSGIIGVFQNEENFNTHKVKYSRLKDVSFQFDDNPILVLYEIKI